MAISRFAAQFEAQLVGEPTDSWIGYLIQGVRAMAPSPTEPSMDFIERLAAVAGESPDDVARPARGRSRGTFLFGFRRGLVFNIALGAILLIGSAAVATVAGVAPEPVQSIISEVASWIGLDIETSVPADPIDDEGLDTRAPKRTGTIENAGPKEDSNAPDHAGPPEQAGPPDHAGPGENAGPKEDSNAPDHAGPPEQAGPPDHAGPGENAGPKEDSNAPDHAGPPGYVGPPEHAGPGGNDDPGPPNHAGPKGGVGPNENSNAPEHAGGSE